jgi:hypothetical protein
MLTDRLLLKSDFSRQFDHRRGAPLTAQLFIEQLLQRLYMPARANFAPSANALSVNSPSPPINSTIRRSDSHIGRRECVDIGGLRACERARRVGVAARVRRISARQHGANGALGPRRWTVGDPAR